MPEVTDYILRVSAGPNFSNLQTVPVNDEHSPIYVDSENYTGFICVRMVEFNGVTPALEKEGGKHEPIRNPKSNYFEGKHRRYSMMTQGRFKHSISGDDIVFGAEVVGHVDTPPGTSIAIKIAKWLDPAIDAQCNNEKAYMYSPLVSSMNGLAIYRPDTFALNEDEKKESDEEAKDPLPAIATLSLRDPLVSKWQFYSKPVTENSQLLFTSEKHQKAIDSYEKRKKHFSNIKHRQEVTISPDYIYCMDFYDAYFDLNTISVKLPGFSLNAFKYFNGSQILQYTCKSRDGSKVFFAVQFEYRLRSEYGL